MQMILLMGLQASGKSTFSRTHFATTHEYVSMDLLRNNKKPSHRQLQLVEDALSTQRSVVIDNTNPTVEARARLISLGHQYGAEIVGYYFEPQVKQCIERNKQRIGKARVPDVAIYATAKKLVRPSYTEGFDKLYNVNIANNSAFEVHEVIKSPIFSPVQHKENQMAPRPE